MFPEARGREFELLHSPRNTSPSCGRTHAGRSPTSRRAAGSAWVNMAWDDRLIYPVFQVFQLFRVSNSALPTQETRVAALSLNRFFGFLWFNVIRLEGSNQLCFVLLEAYHSGQILSSHISDSFHCILHHFASAAHNGAQVTVRDPISLFSLKDWRVDHV